MGTTPASLIDGLASVFSPPTDDINPILEQYELRPGQPYLSGMHVMTAVNGPWGMPYWMQGLALQTCNNMYITAPEALQKSIITHRVDAIYTAGQFVVGQAPTGGIFTGVEDKCG